MERLQKYAEEIRQRRLNEPSQKEKFKRWMELRSKHLDALLLEHLGPDIVNMLREAKIGREYHIGAKTFVVFDGQDHLGRVNYIKLGISEQIISEMDPDNLILILDKYILRGYEIPPAEPDGTIRLNLDLHDFGDGVPEFSPS